MIGPASIVVIILIQIVGSVYSAAAQQGTYQLPTATEIFNLRSRCIALGDQILESISIGAALTQSQVSHYEPRTNRCYVELTIRANLNIMDYLERTLYDGQTREILAFAKIEKGRKSGIVFDKQHKTKNLDNEGFDDASAYIDEVMADGRK
jgi:cAMP phosphodiesterase